MYQRLKGTLLLGLVFAALPAGTARAQWGMPGGMMGWEWMGFGVGTAQGDIARGEGMFLMGAGIYNQLTAEAEALNTETVMRWNEYVHEAQANANRLRAERRAGERERTKAAIDARLARLRDNPEPRDINQGDALNASLDIINDPRVYVKALQAAKMAVPSQVVRNIPFRYAAAAITYSLHDLVGGHLPEALRAPQFAAEREAIAALEKTLFESDADEVKPDPAVLDKLLAAIYSAEEKVAAAYQRGTRPRFDADRFLKAAHGLVVMLKSPQYDVILAGLDKRESVPLGELLNFMKAFNLRFGVANTAGERTSLNTLHPMLVTLREEIRPALAAAGPAPSTDQAMERFFSSLSYDDLQKKAPRPK
ncbi:hypothetical protein OJF2_57130 [Aquisphaera giovannonii]|uniref:Uncharacterized protein n=1 Tax=Aquisphaera giovannonii TaxID=406548 RepID=A0A5B9W971_9BACT|nr:hypothetical protein [Aquisphaera giovannonii]QEH37126.1 hypothetical protein OJF2_57130 [Aquisphaera giovannonii]